MEIVAVDIGGTHARFAIAEIIKGEVARIGPETVLKTAEYASFATALQAYARQAGQSLPRALAIAIAGPVDTDTIKLTNNSWIIRPAQICEQLDVDSYTIVNDFAAVAHAVAVTSLTSLRHVCGPDRPLPGHGVVTVVGPGTGLGVAILYRGPDGDRVIATEGGHIDFAPLDAVEDAMLAALRKHHRRVSVERIVSGPGLSDIHALLAAIEGPLVVPLDDKALWTLALSGKNGLARAALDRFCLSLGSVAGDLALAHGATAVVIGGGVGLRLADHLPQSGFAERFAAKGRFAHRMADIPVKLITYEQPGLLGAAAAFASEHR